QSPATFTERLISDTATGATSIFPVDVDSDGDMDLIATHFDSTTVGWYDNNGAATPTFTFRTVDASFIGGRSTWGADLDSDGDIDLLAAGETGNLVTWYENNGASTPGFVRRTVTNNIVGATSVAAADLDRDGHMDVMSASEVDNLVAWYRNDGAAVPTFTKYVISAESDTALWLSPADVDGDGDVDVALASIDDNAISWFRNDGNQTGWTRTVATLGATGARAVHVADIDLDGDIDLVGGSEFDDTVAWFENVDGAGTMFTAHELSSAVLGASSVHADDMDGDGDIDIVSVGFDSSTVNFFENELVHREARLQPAAIVVSGASGVASISMADPDHDGDVDLIAAVSTAGELTFERNDGAAQPSFSSQLVTALAAGASAVARADLDRDGDEDLIAASAGNDTIAWFESDGAVPPVFTRNVISATMLGASGVAIGDIDADGDPDVVASSADDDTVAWFESDGAADPTFTLRTIVTTADGASDVAVADIDADGDLDVVASSALDDRVVVHQNDGAALPTFSPIVLSSASDGANAIEIADVDDDGDLDVLVVSSLDDRLVWYANDGASPIPAFSEFLISAVVDGASDVVAADLDADGDLDLAVTSADDDTVAWYE
ncbi:MAG: VCBS repeat-containing protein, partial [Saonia sp.]